MYYLFIRYRQTHLFHIQKKKKYIHLRTTLSILVFAVEYEILSNMDEYWNIVELEKHFDK